MLIYFENISLKEFKYMIDFLDKNYIIVNVDTYLNIKDKDYVLIIINNITKNEYDLIYPLLSSMNIPALIGIDSTNINLEIYELKQLIVDGFTLCPCINKFDDMFQQSILIMNNYKFIYENIYEDYKPFFFFYNNFNPTTENILIKLNCKYSFHNKVTEFYTSSEILKNLSKFSSG